MKVLLALAQPDGNQGVGGLVAPFVLAEERRGSFHLILCLQEPEGQPGQSEQLLLTACGSLIGRDIPFQTGWFLPSGSGCSEETSALAQGSPSLGEKCRLHHVITGC